MTELKTKMSEGIHYELTPIDGAENDQAWGVRLLEGPHPETIVKIGNIAFDEEDNGDPCLKFNFLIESTPDSSLTEDDLTLQAYVSDVLEDILVMAAAEGSLVLGDPDESED
jgi:hypothetical protein